MQQLKFNVAGQTLTRTDSLRVVADSVGQHEALFAFDDDSWDGYVATAQYTKNGVTYDENIVDGVAEVPAEALVGSGQFHVHVVGDSPDGKRITVNDLLVPVEPSGWRPKSSISAGPDITVWHKVVAMLLFLKGGLSGQFLRKKSADSYDGEWVTLPIDINAAYRTAAEVDAAVAEINETLSGKEDTANKVTSIDGDSTDEQYPSAKVVYDTIAGVASYKEDTANKVTSVDGDSTDEQYPSAKALYNFKLSDQNFTGNTINGIALSTNTVSGNRIMNRTIFSTKIHPDYLGITISSASTDEHLATGKAVYTYAQPKSLYFSEVSASSWTSDTTYAGYGYKCEISLTGVTAAMVPHVYFSGTDALSGNYAPPPESYNGGIYLYGKTDAEITVSEIVLEATS